MKLRVFLILYFEQNLLLLYFHYQKVIPIKQITLKDKYLNLQYVLERVIRWNISFK